MTGTGIKRRDHRDRGSLRTVSAVRWIWRMRMKLGTVTTRAMIGEATTAMPLDVVKAATAAAASRKIRAICARIVEEANNQDEP